MSERDLIVSNLDVCWTSVVEFLSTLENSQWETQSLCPEWTIRGVAAHMVSVEQALSNWLPSGLDTPPPFEKVGGYGTLVPLFGGYATLGEGLRLFRVTEYDAH